MNIDAEMFLWDRLHGISERGPTPRSIIEDMVRRGLISSPKQAWRTLEKWTRRGWYDYGVSLDMGWRTGNGAPAHR